MMSVARLVCRPAARAAALLAVLALGWQGALPRPPVTTWQIADAARHETTLSRANLTPAYTILPTAPGQVAKPSPPTQRPFAAAAPAAPSPQSILPVAPPAAAIVHTATRRVEALFFPPYAARGPPLLS